MPPRTPVVFSSIGATHGQPDNLLSAGGLVVRPVSELPAKLKPRETERATADDDYDVQRY